MGKVRLGRRSRLFRERMGNDVDPTQVLIAAIDAAKFIPKAALFDYFGALVLDPFFFTPDRDGVDVLCRKALEALAGSDKQKIIFGVENTGHYHEPIVRLLEERGQTVLPLNAVTTKQEKKALLDYSKTDDLDLEAIATAVAGGKVTFSKIPQGLEAELRFLVRTRRHLVRQMSRTLVVVRTILDHYWPYLQGIPEIVHGKPRVIKIFTDLTVPGFITFLRLQPTPAGVLTLGEEGLAQLSRQYELRLGTRKIELILRSADLAKKVDEGLLSQYVYHLHRELENLEKLNREIGKLEQQIEAILVQTKGLLLLSIQGIGVVTAAEFMAEAGLAIARYHSASAVIKLAGTNPVPDESAGRCGRMRISRQGNPYLREAVYLIGKVLSEAKGNPYFKEFRHHLSCRFLDQKRLAVGNKFVRVAYAMLTKGELFAPPAWDGPPLTVDPLIKLRPENRETARETLAGILKANNTPAA